MKDRLDLIKYWNEMHSILGTAFSDIKELTETAQEVRRGDIKDAKVSMAMAHRDIVIGSGMQVMRKAFQQNFKKLFS